MTEQRQTLPCEPDAPVLWWLPEGVSVESPDLANDEEEWSFRPFMARQHGENLSATNTDSRRLAQRKLALEEVLIQRKTIVHTVEDGDSSFQWALLSQASRLGYRHRVLHWPHRLQALRVVARSLGWSAKRGGLPQLLQADATIQKKLAYVCRLMQTGHHDWLLVPVDSLDPAVIFGQPASSLKSTMMRALQAASEPLDERSEAVLIRETAWLTDLQQMPCFLKPQVSHPEDGDPRVKVARVNGLPPWLGTNEELNLDGIVLFDSESPSRLTLQQGGGIRDVHWPQPSPGVAAKWPDLPAARAARFQGAHFRADAREPARLTLQPVNGPEIPVLEFRFQPRPRPQVPGIFIARWSIGYQPIPKVACTSLKQALFRLVMKEPYSPDLGGGAPYIHDYFYQREQDVTQAAWRFLVVRDPIQRFLSGYSNRVLHHRELSREYIAGLSGGLGLNRDEFPYDPDLETFIANFELYCRVPTIRHHFRPISEFVPPLVAFDRVYAFEEISTLADDISQRTGQPFTIPHTQRGGPKLTVGQIGMASMKKLIDIYAGDYEMLAGYYTPPGLSAASE